MIRISTGLPGSGKTACAVRDLMINRTGRLVYSNIVTKHLPNNKLIKPDYIFKKEVTEIKHKRSGEDVPVYALSVNVDYWRNIKEPISVVIDEAHSIIDSRRSLSKKSKVVLEWVALLRRTLGASESGYGELHFITQLPRSIDKRARDMATQVRHHVCHYLKTCDVCNLTWQETNDEREPTWQCPRCGSYKLKKHSHKIEVFHFANMQMYEAYELFGMQSYHRHYFINDIEKVFPLYDTLQWDNLFSEIDV